MVAQADEMLYGSHLELQCTELTLSISAAGIARLYVTSGGCTDASVLRWYFKVSKVCDLNCGKITELELLTYSLPLDPDDRGRKSAWRGGTFGIEYYLRHLRLPHRWRPSRCLFFHLPIRYYPKEKPERVDRQSVPVQRQNSIDWVPD